MTALFVAFKKKNSKRYIGIGQSSPGSTREKIRDRLRRTLPKNMTARIVTAKQALMIVRRQAPRSWPTKKRVAKRTSRSPRSNKKK